MTTYPLIKIGETAEELIGTLLKSGVKISPDAMKTIRVKECVTEKKEVSEIMLCTAKSIGLPSSFSEATLFSPASVRYLKDAGLALAEPDDALYFSIICKELLPGDTVWFLQIPLPSPYYNFIFTAEYDEGGKQLLKVLFPRENQLVHPDTVLAVRLLT